MISGQRPWDGEPAAHTCHRSLRGDTRSSPRTGTLPRRHTGKAASLFQPRFAPSHILPWSLSPAGVLQGRKGQYGHSRAGQEQTQWHSPSLLNLLLHLQSLNFVSRLRPYSFQQLVQLPMRDLRKQQGMILQLDLPQSLLPVSVACYVHICSGLRKYSILAENTCTLYHTDCQRGHASSDSYLLPYKPHA